MDRLDSMKVFVRVVEASSYTKAAAMLHLSAATVSRMVQGLEAHMNVRLLNRTTRTVSVTEEGRAFYESCLQVLSLIDEMEQAATGAERSPKGRIRVSLPASIAKNVVIPALPTFFAAYPKVEVDMVISDRHVDLVEEGVDCAIRVGPIEDGALIAKQVGEVSRIICASPTYLERYGEPKTLKELEEHLGVSYVWSNGARVRPWEFYVDGGAESVRMKSQVMVNDADSYFACGLAGLGIVAGYQFALGVFLKNSALKEILKDYRLPPRAVSVLYQPNRHMPHKLRVFIDWLKTVFEEVIHASA